MSRIIIYTHDALLPIKNGGIIFRPVISPGSGHGTKDPAGHLINADRIVIHTDQFSVRTAFVKRCQTGSGSDHVLSGQELDQVSLMNAKIRHSAHGSPFFVEKPDIFTGSDGPGFRPAMSEGGSEGDDAPDQTFINEFLRRHVSFRQALVVTDHQEFPGLFGFRDHCFTIFQGDSHRFFTEHMFSCPQCFDGQLRVGIVRHADRHRVDIGSRKQFFRRCISLSAVFCGHFLCPFQRKIKESA